MNRIPAMAPLSPAGPAGSPSPPTPASLAPAVKATFQSLGSLSPGMLSPSPSRASAPSALSRRASSPLHPPSASIMSSPKQWQKASISRLAEEFFWIGGSVVAQPKWRLGQIVERCMYMMQNGSQMTKLKGKKKGLVRFFYLDEHKSCIRWRPSRKHDKAKIMIDSIHEVCEGKKSEIFQRYAENRFDPNCCFSIYHGNHLQSLNLVSANGEEARTWITGLKYLMAGISDEDSFSRRQRKRDQWLQQTFSEADKNGDGTLSISEVHQLLHKLNVNLPKQKVREMFQEADTDENQGSLGFEEFCCFYKMISTRRDLYLILLSYSNQKEVMDLNDLARFLETEQKMRGINREHLVEIVAQFEPCPENLQRMVLGIDGFTKYMRSPAGDVFNPVHFQVNQDMTQPLSNYFINSSHNTYLTGDQLMSESRADMYAYALQAGCRCVEVDCWDGPDGEPIIHHGYTLTSKILFKDVIETINRYAFTKSPYPVIVSIENHCSVPQQKKMAQYIIEVLQDKVDLSNVNVETRKLPSPEILKGKVLFKGKKLPANLDPNAEEGDVSDYDTGDEDSEEDEDIQAGTDGNGAITAKQPKKKRRLHKSIIRSFKRKRKKKKKPMSKGESESQSNKDHTQIVYHPNNKNKKTMRLSRALSDLIKYTKAVRVHDIETQALQTSWQVSSLNENVMNQILELQPAQLVRLNQRQLVRVYPSNFRVDSSNFCPQPYWNTGCHMAALNFQTEGRMLEVNRAKFLSNGNCGYVLKPKCMCKGAFNPMVDEPQPGYRKTQLELKIISGQHLPKPKDSMLGDRGEIIDPFVEVEIIGLPVDSAKQQTRVVEDNGFNPMWEETMVFNMQMPQIALVRFQVWNQETIGQNYIGQRTIAFISMMPGYRHVYLEGQTTASIFVHIAIKDMSGKVKSTNAVKVAKKHIKKAAKKQGFLMKGHKIQKRPSMDHSYSVESSEDAYPLHYRKDVDSLGPAAKAALHGEAMSEPVRRAHRVQIQDPPKTSSDVESGSPPWWSYSSAVFEDQIPLQTDRPADSELENLHVREPTFQPSLPESPETGDEPTLEEISVRPETGDEPTLEEISVRPETGDEPALEPPLVSETQGQSESLPQLHRLAQPPALIPPSSPARVRRTLQAPRPTSPPMRSTARSQSCPRKQTTSPPHTPMVNRSSAVHWHMPPAQHYGSYRNQMKPIANGLCVSDSTSSSDGSSIDSLELACSSVPAGGEKREGTLQREMNALFDQKMREIRCTSPLFFDDHATL